MCVLDRKKEEAEFNDMAMEICQKYLTEQDELALIRIRHFADNKVSTSGAIAMGDPFTIVRAMAYLIQNFKIHSGLDDAQIIKMLVFIVNNNSDPSGLDVAGFMKEEGGFDNDWLKKHSEEMNELHLASEKERNDLVMEALRNTLPPYCENLYHYIKKVLDKPIEN